MNQRELFLQTIIRVLPANEKPNAEKYLSIMDEYFEKQVKLLTEAYQDERLPQVLKVGTVRRIIAGCATMIYFTEGIMALIDTIKTAAQSIIIEKTQRELERDKNADHSN